MQDEASREEVEDMLDALGYEVLEVRDEEPWSLGVRVTPDVVVGVAPDGERDGIQVDLTVDVDPADLEALRAAGPAASAFTAQVKDMLLADHLEYDMQMDGDVPRRVQVFEHLQSDALSYDALERCVRRVKDAYYRIAVALDRAVAPRRGEGRRTRASTASVTSLPVEPATLAALEAALAPGQTFDELLHDLLARRSG